MNDWYNLKEEIPEDDSGFRKEQPQLQAWVEVTNPE